ncbi:MAG TPA: FkbM family methyltransferase [Candidatus Methylomirabilis sp.]|nr:FkbM family methyltransferase [Candidatus Methylomirabilis sp.]
MWRKFIPEDIKQQYRLRSAKKTYSQQGEDRILADLGLLKKRGFYVDIGAHHPLYLSNTRLLYQFGWQGINIDPLPGMKKIFDRSRSRDINLEIAVSDRDGEEDYYIFAGPDNTLNREEAIAKKGLKNSLKVKTRRLAGILDDYASGKKIDLLNIDVENYEDKILRSNNWQKYRPGIILVEIRELDLENMDSSPIHLFLKNLGYKIFAKTLLTAFYQDANIA